MNSHMARLASYYSSFISSYSDQRQSQYGYSADQISGFDSNLTKCVANGRIDKIGRSPTRSIWLVVCHKVWKLLYQIRGQERSGIQWSMTKT